MGNERSKMDVPRRQDETEKEKVKKPSLKEDKTKAKHVPGEGIRSMKTSSVFRALNFELFAKPSKPVMLIGVVGFSLALGYLVYMRHNYNKKEFYEALSEEGTIVLREKKSRWDS